MSFSFLKQLVIVIFSMKSKRKIKLPEHLDDQQSLPPATKIGPISTIRKIKKNKANLDPSLHTMTQGIPPSLNLQTQQNFQPQQTSQNLKKKTQFSSEIHFQHNHTHSSPQNSQDKYTTEELSRANSGIMDEKEARQLAIKAANNQNLNLFSRRKQEFNLKEVVSRQKVDILKNKFISKIKRNNESSKPVQYEGFDEGDKSSIWQWEVFEAHQNFVNIMNIISILVISTLLYLYSLQLVFKELNNTQFERYLQIFSLIFFLGELAFNSTTIKNKNGKKIRKLGQTLDIYLRQSMVIDICNILMLIVAISWKGEAMIYLRLFIATKIPQCSQKLQRLEAVFIKTFYNEQYWSLVKVIIFNFIFAHVLAIILSAMAKIQINNNWQTQKGIDTSSWSSKYIWSYYWAVNIMLTVGFGDLTATNSDEALCLIFIEIISVMCLAYNINWVGTLISNIRAQDIQKSKNFKTFKHLSSKYSLPSELQWRISNYIDESVNIRKQFNIEEEKAFVQSLPTTMKKDYLKESNKGIFYQLPFFASLVNKTIHKLSQKIEMNISHPQQILKRIEDDHNLMILRKGHIGYTVKKRNCDFNDMVIDTVKVESSDKPFLLGLQFLTRNRPTYETKSLQYSVICSLGYEDLMGILRESHMDYMLFCFLRDRNKSNLDQFEVMNCQICKKGIKHTKFTCPKLHYSPIHQMVIHKQNKKACTMKNMRNKDKTLRIIGEKRSSLKYLFEMHENMKDKPYTNQKNKLNHQVNQALISKFNEISRSRKNISQKKIEMFEQNFEERFINNTTQLIKQQFDSFRRKDNYFDEVWTIKLDQINHFKEYFPESNAAKLQYSAIMGGHRQNNRTFLSNPTHLNEQTMPQIDSLQLKLSHPEFFKHPMPSLAQSIENNFE